MTDFRIDADKRGERARPGAGDSRPPVSMHENVAVWCDCCTCEAEPYWVAVAEELGIDLDGPKGTGRDA